MLFSEGLRIDKIAALLDRVKALEDCQYELLLLRYTAGFPKFNFALRTIANTPPDVDSLIQAYAVDMAPVLALVI